MRDQLRPPLPAPPGAQVPPSLRRLTREVVARWQLPRGASLKALAARGLA